MKSLYDESQAKDCLDDLALRVYTSRLLGQDTSLVLHGGGNTSVKSTVKNIFGDVEDILYVKGSGWDLATIESEGFAPVKMDMLLKMAKLNLLSDSDMVKYQRVAMIDPSAPNPSVEAILHAIIPFKFVEHTHADAIVTITNTANSEDKIKEIYGDRVLIIPYIMPGFVLAKLVYEMTKEIDWSKLEGMVLMNHGLFTFSNDAKVSYEKTIELVNMAKDYLTNSGCELLYPNIDRKISESQLIKLAKIRKEVSILKGYPIVSMFNDSKLAYTFANEELNYIATQGPLTPDHVIRTKRIPAILGDDFKLDLKDYIQKYKNYFLSNKKDETMLNPAPNFAILEGVGSISFGKNIKEASIIKDINEHTFEAILKAQKLGGYKALSAKDIFDVEYWSLEQAKLKKATFDFKLSGKVAVILGDLNDICLKIENRLKKDGCSVVLFDKKQTIESVIKRFGGIDIVVSTFKDDNELIKQFKPFVELGIDGCMLRVVPINNDDFLVTKLDNVKNKSSKIEIDSKKVADLVSLIITKV